MQPATLERKLEIETGRLAETFPLFDASTIQHAYEINKDRITDKSLRNRWFWTADFPMYRVENEDSVLDAIERKDYTALKQIVNGQNVVFSGNYGEFQDASAKSDFIKGMSSTYVVLRPADEARKVFSGYLPVDDQRNAWIP